MLLIFFFYKAKKGKQKTKKITIYEIKFSKTLLLEVPISLTKERGDDKIREGSKLQALLKS